MIRGEKCNWQADPEAKERASERSIATRFAYSLHVTIAKSGCFPPFGATIPAIRAGAMRKYYSVFFKALSIEPVINLLSNRLHNKRERTGGFGAKVCVFVHRASNERGYGQILRFQFQFNYRLLWQYMKWILHRSRPSIFWWYGAEGEQPRIEVFQNCSGTRNWYRHTTLERDGVGPGQAGPFRTLKMAKTVVLLSINPRNADSRSLS